MHHCSAVAVFDDNASVDIWFLEVVMSLHLFLMSMFCNLQLFHHLS